MSTALERYGPPGHRPGDHGRVYSSMGGYNLDLALLDLLVAISELVAEGTLDSLVRAAELANRIGNKMLLPPGTWCMVGRYYASPNTEPDRFDESVWSAHYTEEQAHSWASAYDSYFEVYHRRNGWPSRRRFHAAQRDDALAYQLCRADADPAAIAAAVHR